MKKLIYSLAIVLMLSISANSVKAANSIDKAKTEMNAEQRAQFEKITNRVEEIRHMDKSQLTRAEKKELRNELKEMKTQARAIGGGGVYLSVGAIIIIILLLILIL
jgi:ribosomal protein L20A (L18A)